MKPPEAITAEYLRLLFWTIYRPEAVNDQVITMLPEAGATIG
jgi:hypothetical protein